MIEQVEELGAIVSPWPVHPRIAAIGLSSWDQILVVDQFPAVGSYAITRQTASLPGGTTANSAVTLAKLGAEVRLVSLVGDDAEGRLIHTGLERHGVDTRWVKRKTGQSTDRAFIVVSQNPPERTIFWEQGARLVLGDQLDIASIFAHDVVIIDVDDAKLRRFLVDLPAHTLPLARLLGTLTYLVEIDPIEALEIALLFDTIVGNERELIAITQTDSLNEALTKIQQRMVGKNLRFCVVTRGAEGSTSITSDDLWDAPVFDVDVADTTGAGDAFAGATAYAYARRWQWPLALRFANAVAALSTRRLGAQTSLPTLAEVATLMGVHADLLRS